MGKVKIKRKSTLIDMTAMSDVTVLLLTFFMLTSTFLQKEPTIVYTPSSVSTEKVPVSDLVTILVSSADKSGKLDDPTFTEGKIFISFAGDSVLPSELLRSQVLDKAVALYNKQHEKDKKNPPITLTEEQKAAFIKTNMLGTPFHYLPEVLSMDVVKRDQLMGDLTNEDPDVYKRIGVPINNNTDEDHLNDFQIWMKALKSVAQDVRDKHIEDLGMDKYNPEDREKIQALNDLYTSVTQGQAISIKADKDAPFSVVNQIFENLRFVELNKFTMMTALKSMEQN
ncbi:MAG: biopolymer transporter ExbD [Muribaculaceae bacterium]|nr:biopolymer transporter ExbD [Muribaculaceae bacterium]